MTTERPTGPDPSRNATDQGIGGNLPNLDDPSRVGGGFPTGAVQSLRNAVDHPHVAEEAVVSRTAALAVLAWIDRYVPREVGTEEGWTIEGGIAILTIDAVEPKEVDLIRFNGQPFVPETMIIALDEAMCWWEDEDGAPCGEEPVAGEGRGARCERHAEVVRGRCRICGCTENRACSIVTPGSDVGAAMPGHYGSRPCGWTDETRTLCDAPNCLARAASSRPEWPVTPPANHEGVNRAHSLRRPLIEGLECVAGEETVDGLFPGDPGYVRPL